MKPLYHFELYELYAYIYELTGGNRKGLKDHLKVDHIATQSVDSSTPPAKKFKPITKFFDAKKRITLETKVSQIYSLSCVSFKVLAQDTDIREALSYQGYNLPKFQSQLRDLVVKKHEQVTEEVKVKLARMKAQNVKFCVTTDEYTSGRNHCYVNLNCHFKGDFFSLGVPRAQRSIRAEKQIALIEVRLSMFDLDFARDVIAISTDGVSCNDQNGNELLKFYGVEQIICNAYTVHLVVGDIFYKDKNAKVADNNDDFNEQVEEESDDNFEGHDETFELKREYKNLVAKVRKVVKMFRKSPVKNEVKVSKSLEHALVDMNNRFDFSLEDFETMKDIIDALEPLSILVLNLCKRDSTLVTAERHSELTMDTCCALGTYID